MVQGRLGRRRVTQGRQLRQSVLRVLQPQSGRLPQLVRQALQLPGLLQAPDRLQLDLGRLHRLVQVGRVTVHPPVHAAPQVLLQLGVHDLHGGQGRADGGKEVLDALTLLEIGDIVGLPGGLLGLEARLPHQGGHLPAHVVVGGGQLQVIGLPGVGDRPPRQERPPEEGSPAAGLLQHGEVHVVCQTARIHPEGPAHCCQLGRVRDAEAVLPLPIRQTVKGEAERLAEQDREPLGKCLVLRDDADLPPGKGVAVKQNAVCLRLGAAFPVQRRPAQLPLGLSCKGHGLTPQ